jgi:hypothetical protein
MAQTKRKRRTKHRGNAAGMVEARGRTGRAPTEAERNRAGASAGRGRGRVVKPPSLKGAFTKALLMSVILFVITRIGWGNSEIPVSQSIIVAAIALALYTPLSYYTDSFVYRRQQKKLAQSR